ncbi:MAG: rhodanese-like domain-containing protein [Pseudomonadales bacterium]|nr:rhodanese-like domain-containing protein [Pseudomonadales bacterium]
MFSRIKKWIPVGKVPELSSEELNLLLKNSDDSVQILDVRTRAEWRSGHIKGATNIPIINLNSAADDLNFDKSTTVVTICLSAHRSIPAVRVLTDLGYTDVKQLTGGMRAWNKLYKHELEKP